MCLPRKHLPAGLATALRCFRRASARVLQSRCRQTARNTHVSGADASASLVWYWYGIPLLINFGRTL